MEIPPNLAALARTAGAAPAAVRKDWKAAEGFAAMAIGELLRPMFETVDLSKTRFGGGIGAAAWQPMFVAEIGRGIASRGGLGIGAMVFRELLREQQGQKSDAGDTIKQENPR